MPKVWYTNKHGSKDEDGSFHVSAFAKCGGKYLGKLYVPHVPASTESSKVVKVVRSLQRQAAELLPHHERTFEYVTIWLDSHTLPEMAYEETQVDKALEVLSTKQPFSRAELAWNTDDSEALRRLDFVYYNKNTQKVIFMLCQNAFECDLLKFVKVVPYTYLVSNVHITNDARHEASCEFPFEALSKIKALSVLRLENLHIKTWTWCNKAKVTCLDLENTFISIQDLLGFVCLKELRIARDVKLGFPCGLLKRLPLVNLVIVLNNLHPDLIDDWKKAFQELCSASFKRLFIMLDVGRTSLGRKHCVWNTDRPYWHLKWTL